MSDILSRRRKTSITGARTADYKREFAKARKDVLALNSVVEFLLEKMVNFLVRESRVKSHDFSYDEFREFKDTYISFMDLVV